MNQLRHLKQYQTTSEGEPAAEMTGDSKVDQKELLEALGSRYTDKEEEGEGLEFIDLSNIQNIAGLHELAEMRNQAIGQERDELASPLNVDNIAVDLDEDELEQMQRMIGREVEYDKEQQQAIDSHDQSLEKLQDYMMSTPPSNLSESEQKNKQILNKHQNQIKNELRQLLAQSSSEQLLMANDEGMNQPNLEDSEEQELRKKWLHENGLFSQEPSQPYSPSGKDLEIRDDNGQQFYARPEDKSMELGEQPLDVSNKDLLNEDFELDQIQPAEKVPAQSESPPLVASKVNSHGASKSSHSSGVVPLLPRRDQQVVVKGTTGESYNQNQDLKLMVQNDEKPQFPLSQDAQAMSSPKEGKHAVAKGKDVEKAIDQSNGEGDENDSFHRLYNKEIKVNQDEIPLLLLELTDIAYKFIKKDQFEKAYVLLQKTESVLEVVNLDHSKRDKYFAYITYLNMAMCFQKLGMLEECIIYLKETIQVIEKPNFFKDISISQRMKQMHMQCQLKLQLCAILSQTQKHTEAMENAKASVRLAHQILRDMYDLCVFYSNKIKFKDDFASLSLLLMEETEDGNEDPSKANNASKYYTDGFQNSNRGGKPPKHTKSEINEKIYQKQFIRENSPVRDIPFNILEESISMIERTALKLLPIMKELGNRLAGSNGKKGLQAFHTLTGVDSVDTKNLSVTVPHLSEQKMAVQESLKSKIQSKDKGLLVDESEEKDIKDVELEIKEAEKKTEGARKAEDQVDMRTVLGFLNQNEWILNLNIGNIMQIQPIRMRDFLTFNRNEHQLSRESFLEKLQLLVVSYFCVSTELRFIIQSRSGFMKPEVKKEKELEQEYWHVKALDIACAFLPSECPLFNHILLSYQKHHDPTMQPIDEDKEQEDTLAVLRPLKGIENSKYQPIVREVDNVYVDIQEIPMSPLSKCFDQRLMPKKTKTTSVDVQTTPVAQEKQVFAKSQSISIQADLKFPEKEKSPKAAQEVNKNSQTISDCFDANNAYMDLSSSKYQETLITRIIDDPKIDKQAFLNKLISRVSSQDPENFALHSTTQQSRFSNQHTASNQHTQHAQNFAQNSMNFYQQTTNDKTNMHTLSDQLPNSGIMDDAIYGSRHGYKQTKSGKSSLLVNKSKNTQSGQLTKKKAGQGNFEDFARSFDHQHNSQHVKNHVRSFYRDHNNSSSDATAIGGNVKHHIASQSLAPSANVLTEHKHRSKGAGMKQSSHAFYHKKNQSISGPNLAHESSSQTQEMFARTNIPAHKQTMEIGSIQQKFNNSVNSNLSKNTKNTKKKAQDQKIQEQRMNVQAKQSSKDRQWTKINLSNEKGKKGVNRYQNNIVYPKNKERQQSGSKGRTQPKKGPDFPHGAQIHQVPTSKTEHSITKELVDDVMSSSYSQSNKSASSPMSGADPDLLVPQFQSQPEDSLSEMNKTNPTNKSLQSGPEHILPETTGKVSQFKERDHHKDHQQDQRPFRQGLRNMEQSSQQQHQQHQEMSNAQAQFGKSRPSSAFTNYTSGQSAIRSKMNAKRLQQNQKAQGKQHKIQQAQNILQNSKQAKQRYAENGAPLVPKKKSKVLSRKKYGSDHSSNSPPHGTNPALHGYSIGAGPFSIFDSGNSHSVSKFSNMQQSKTQIQQQSVQQPDQMAYHYNDNAESHHRSKKQKQTNHANSQTIQVKDEKPRKSKEKSHQIVQNQSENILGRLQNLLVNKKPDSKKNIVSNSTLGVKQQKYSAGLQQHQQYLSSSNPRKQAHSIGSLGYSQTRQSRFSQNSRKSGSRKSKCSRSKSSGKSASKSGAGPRSQSNERSLPTFVNKSHQDISPNINQSQIVMSNHLLDSDPEARNHQSFELNHLLNEMNKSVHGTDQAPKRKGSRGQSRGRRPKSSLLFENQRESLQNTRQSQVQLKNQGNSRTRVGHAQANRGVQHQKEQNNSLENLQRQVLENQKILMSNFASQQRVSQKQSKRGAGSKGHNHNNSISHMLPGTGSASNYKNLMLLDESRFYSNKSGSIAQGQNRVQQQQQLQQQQQRPGAPLTSSSLAKKKMSTKGKKESIVRQTKQLQYNTSTLSNPQQLGLMTQGGKSGGNKASMKNLKMTQQHLSQGFKQFASIVEAGRGGVSTTASTTGANMNNFQSGKSMRSRKQMNNHKRKQSNQNANTLVNANQTLQKNNQFVNFEQMQQQLENDMTLGGVDLSQGNTANNLQMGFNGNDQIQLNQLHQEQMLGFVPHKNLMPKTTGSQAHLLNIQQQHQQEAASAVGQGLSGCMSAGLKSQYSLNQTGRTSGSLNRNMMGHGRVAHNNQMF